MANTVMATFKPTVTDAPEIHLEWRGDKNTSKHLERELAPRVIALVPNGVPNAFDVVDFTTPDNDVIGQLTHDWHMIPGLHWMVAPGRHTA